MPSSLPFASVIILTFYGEAYIDSLLDSLERQTYPRDRFEIIVADNASDDLTQERVLLRPEIRLVPFSENLGYAQGNNEALKEASGEILVFLNQDTVCQTGWLEGLVETLNASTDIGAACSSMLLPGDKGFLNRTESLPEDIFLIDISPFGYGTRRIFKKADQAFPRIVSGCAFALRRETLNRLDYLFDADFWMYAEDTDLSLRLRNLGLKLMATRRSVVFHLHSASAPPSRKGLNKARIALRNRVIAFYKNLTGVEFAIYFPFLLFGGWAKIFSLPMSWPRRLLYAVPFGVFSMTCMLHTLTLLGRFAAKRNVILGRRKLNGRGQLSLLADILLSNGTAAKT